MPAVVRTAQANSPLRDTMDAPRCLASQPSEAYPPGRRTHSWAPAPASGPSGQSVVRCRLGRRSGPPLLQLPLGDTFAMNLVRTIRQAQGARHGPCIGQERVLRDTLAAVRLDCSINDAQRSVWR